MAQKNTKKSASKSVVKKPASSDDAKVVRRVKASADSVEITTDKVERKAPAKPKKAEKDVEKTKKTEKEPAKKNSHVPRWIRAIGGYFAGSWRELRQVRWPNRKATWSMTAAVLAFTAFFAVLVLLADWIFNWLIKEVIL